MNCKANLRNLVSWSTYQINSRLCFRCKDVTLKKSKPTLIKAAKIIVIVGAILMILLSIMSIAGRILALPFYSPIGLTSGLYIFVSLFGGILALILSRKVGGMIWTLVVIGIGIIGGGLGGLLVFIGGIIAIIARVS